jgi:trk system potassium uptake protein TrkA
VHVVIMGCGRVGSSLAASLERQGHGVAVIDRDAKAFRRLNSDFRGDQVVGIGFHRDVLRRAGAEHAEAFAAVSNGDNSNIIAARVARETFGIERVVARIYDERRAEVYERLGIPTVATVPWTANRLLKSVLGEATSEVWRDPSGAVAMIHVSPHEGWVGHRISDFETSTGTRVALVTRFGNGELPVLSSVIQSGDSLHVLTTDDKSEHLAETASRGPEGTV